MFYFLTLIFSQPCDTSHLSPDDDLISKLISEEESRESFTAVVIQGINTEHVTYLKHHFNTWTRQLAYVSGCLSACRSACLPARLFACLSVCLLVCQPV